MISAPKLDPGLKPGLVSQFYANQGWNIPHDPRFNDKFQYLAKIVCAVGDKFYVKNRNGTWEVVTNKAHTTARVFQEHGGTVSLGGVQKIIDLDDVKAFMAVGIVHFHDTIYAPLEGDFLWFNGERRLNIYKDNRLAGDTDHIANCEEFLKVVRNSLCNAPDELPLEGMLEEIWSDRPTPFRWVMHWLAARYQMPGYTTQTNLWFCGKRGTGKGSLMSVLRMVFGASAVGKIDASDVSRGWSGSLFGADIIEWDEFKGTGWYDLNRFIKEKTGNETFSITKRNIGDVLQPMVAGHIMSTNEDHPMFVESDDRQNCFIATTKLDEWKTKAKALWDAGTNEIVDPLIPSGMAALFNSIELDLPFIRSPLATDLKASLADYFADDSIKAWLTEMTERSIGFETPSWEDLHHNYRQFCLNHTSSKPKDLKTFKKAMLDEKHAEEAFGKRKQPDGTRKSYRYVRLACLHAEQEAELLTLVAS